MQYRGFLFLFLLGFAGRTAGQQKWECDPGWEGSTSTGKCYRLSTRTNTPPNAATLCEAVGGQLAAIKSQEETDLINTKILPKATDMVIINGELILGSGKGWTYSDGTPMDTAYGNYGNPPTSPGSSVWSNYLYLWARPQDKGTPNYGKWYGDQSATRLFLCEKMGTPMLPVVEPIVPPSSSKCGCGCSQVNYCNACGGGGCGCGSNQCSNTCTR